MSQNDFVIANQTAPAFRTDLNSALQALASASSGATAPSTVYANMLWYDTATNILKMRSEANDAWIDIGTLDQGANTFLPALVSPALTGVPTAPTPILGTDTTQVATTEYVVDEIPNQLNATGAAPIFACRAWGLVDASSGTPVVSGSGNVASITDVGDGEYQINFTTALPSAAYAVVCSCKDVDDNAITQSDRTLVLPYSLATGSFRVRTAAAEGGARDVEILTFAVFG